MHCVCKGWLSFFSDKVLWNLALRPPHNYDRIFSVLTFYSLFKKNRRGNFRTFRSDVLVNVGLFFDIRAP